MLVRNMKKDEILGLLAVLVPGPVWASIDFRRISDEYGKFPQVTLGVCLDKSEVNTVSDDTIMAA